MVNLWTGILVIGGLAACISIALLMAASRIRQNDSSPVEAVNSLLPQSQCGQCGYPGCRPYATAIVNSDADINQCAPGGDATATAIAKLLGRRVTPVNHQYGTPGPAQVAIINESECIGCALCLAACPVDAIIGAAHFTHTVLRQECTGCELCVAPCPVDCIVIEPRHGRVGIAA